MISQLLVDDIRKTYRLDWNGIHGAAHWARVRNIGLKLAKVTGANLKVIEAFSVIHDSCRYSDGNDPDHGPRAAQYAYSINDVLLKLDKIELADLMDACIYHTRGMTSGYNINVLTCWDSDRLDLGRVGILPKAEYLCTEIAKTEDVIKWAYSNSITAV